MKVALTVLIGLLFQFCAHSQFLQWNSSALPYKLILLDDTVSLGYELEAEFTCMNLGGGAIKFTKEGFQYQFSKYEYSERIGSDDKGYFRVGVQIGNREGLLDYVGEDVRLKSDEPYMYSFQVRALVAYPKTERIYENGKLKVVIGFNKNQVKVMAEVDENGALVGFGPIDEKKEKTGAWSFFRNGVAVGSKIYSQSFRVSCVLLDMDSIQQGPPIGMEMNLRSQNYHLETIDKIDSAFSYLDGLKTNALYSKSSVTGRFDFFVSYKEDSLVVYSSGRKARVYPNRGSYLNYECPLYFSKNKKEKSMPQGQFDFFYRIIENEFTILLDYNQPEWKDLQKSKTVVGFLSKKYSYIGWYEVNGIYVVSLSALNKEKREEALNTLKADRYIQSICQGITSQYDVELEYFRNEVMFVHKGVYDHEKMLSVAAKYGFKRLPTSATLPNESIYENTSKMTGEDFIARYIKMSKDPAIQGARVQTMSTRNMLD
jgi:hypothetical protein